MLLLGESCCGLLLGKSYCGLLLGKSYRGLLLGKSCCGLLLGKSCRGLLLVKGAKFWENNFQVLSVGMPQTDLNWEGMRFSMSPIAALTLLANISRSVALSCQQTQGYTQTRTQTQRDSEHSQKCYLDSMLRGKRASFACQSHFFINLILELNDRQPLQIAFWELAGGAALYELFSDVCFSSLKLSETPWCSKFQVWAEAASHSLTFFFSVLEVA